MDEFINALAALRAGYLTYRTAHWQTKGMGYYGNHLLLKKIYEETEELADKFAERLVGVCGTDCVELADQYQRTFPFINEWSQEMDPLLRSWRAANGILAQLQRAYDSLKAEGSMTLGVDDLIMSAASDIEQQIYLLQQATSE